MDATHLIVRFKTAQPQVSQTTAPAEFPPLVTATANNCLSCSVTGCFRHQHIDLSRNARTAYLVDDVWAEFDRYIQLVRTDRDRLYLPIDGQKFRKPNYGWNTSGFAEIIQDWRFVLDRSFQSRKLASQGAARQQMLMAQSRTLAVNYGKKLTPDTTHLVIAQSLLPWLWQAGYLGGRTFDVLMTGLPIIKLQQRLNLAHQLHPESSTLGDFRASAELAEWELAALKQATKIITPHADLARLWADKTELLDWIVPTKLQLAGDQQIRHQPIIVLPGSSLGRKGIYELRAAITDLDLALVIVGNNLEQREFWQGYPVSFESDYGLALQQADLVVLPAWVEHQPRRMLQAIAAGIPTITTTACGLHHLPTISVEMGDVASLKQAIATQLNLVTATTPDQTRTQIETR
jgi:Glycosyl transferases group 1